MYEAPIVKTLTAIIEKHQWIQTSVCQNVEMAEYFLYYELRAQQQAAAKVDGVEYWVKLIIQIKWNTSCSDTKVDVIS